MHVEIFHEQFRNILFVSKCFKCDILFENYMIMTTHYRDLHEIPKA